MRFFCGVCNLEHEWVFCKDCNQEIHPHIYIAYGKPYMGTMPVLCDSCANKRYLDLHKDGPLWASLDKTNTRVCFSNTYENSRITGIQYEYINNMGDRRANVRALIDDRPYYGTYFIDTGNIRLMPRKNKKKLGAPQRWLDWANH
jgi:hypothetical protein